MNSLFPYLLISHSWNRWAILLLLLYAITNAYFSKNHQRKYTSTNKITSTLLLVSLFYQMALGLFLYWKSPLSQFFIQNINQGLHIREVRFFGLEHIFVMLTAIVVICTGCFKIHYAKTDKQKHLLTIKWMGIGLFLILTSIPWSFSPLISRPLFRLI